MFFSAVHQGGCGGRRYVCGERGYVHLYVGVYGAKGQPQVLFLRSCPFLEKKIIPFTLILFVYPVHMHSSMCRGQRTTYGS